MAEYLNNGDWDCASEMIAKRRISDPTAKHVPYCITHGMFVLCFITVDPDFQEEVGDLFAEKKDCEEYIAQLAEARAEAHADPYPDRQYPEAEMN